MNLKLSDEKTFTRVRTNKLSGKKLSDAFSGISDKKLSDKYDIKKQARYQKDVKNDCDSIININVQKVHGDNHIYKDI